MKISNLGIQEMNHQAMIKLNGGQVKPFGQGSSLANVRAKLFKQAGSLDLKEGPKASFFAYFWSKLTLGPSVAAY